jgi:hypothetical protein
MQLRIDEKNQVKLMRKAGKGIREISKELGLAKSSVSGWCKGIVLTDSQLERLKAKRPDKNYGAIANKVKREVEVDAIRLRAKLDFDKIQKDESRRIDDVCTALYWAEGAKRNSKQVDFTNSDPEMARLIMWWLRNIHKVPESKFRAAIYYHLGQDELEIKKYWSEITGISLQNFHKSIFKKEGTGHRKNLLYNGTCKIRVCNCDLLHKILANIEQLYI